MKTIVIATRNRKKLAEIQRVVHDIGVRDVEFLTADAFPSIADVVEDGETFCQNADKKSLAFASATGLVALADDSGLAVDALGGMPGVRSARYAHERATDQENLHHVLNELADVPDEKRVARFVCVLSVANPRGVVGRFEGMVEGRLIREPRGASGFGYDPVFVPAGYGTTFAEMGAAEKDGLSHRGEALRAFAAALRDDPDRFWEA
jgi:XTP/dITP diphosphohydrolase